MRSEYLGTYGASAAERPHLRHHRGYSDRIAEGHAELVDQSADWLEDEMGVLNLGQIDHAVLMADGPLTDELRNGLVAWWTARVGDLRV